MFTLTTKNTKINSRALWRQLAMPGGTGGLGAYRDAFCTSTMTTAVTRSPVNKRLNALHRGGVVGTYVGAWDWSRSNKRGAWIVGGQVINTAPHAQVVELGRSSSREPQRFSWSKYPGKIRWYVGRKGSLLEKTSARPGKHVLEGAAGTTALDHASICARARANSPYSPL